MVASFTAMFHNDTATYWQCTGIDGFGKPTFAAPTTIKCRWEQRVEKVFTPEGEQIMSKARLFLGQSIAINDYIFYGTSAALNPLVVPNAYRVIDYREIPGFGGTEPERRALL